MGSVVETNLTFAPCVVTHVVCAVTVVFGEKCGIPVYFEDSCIKNKKKRAKAPKGDCGKFA